MIDNKFTTFRFTVYHLSLNADGDCEEWGIIKNKHNCSWKKRFWGVGEAF